MPTPPEPNGIVHAHLLDGKGGARPLDWSAIQAHGSQEGTLWLHCHVDQGADLAWLGNLIPGDPILQEALVEEESQPRITQLEEGLLLTLRGINLNPGAEPDDMVFINIWATPQLVVTVRSQRVQSVQDLRLALERAKGPRDAGEMVTFLALALLDHMEPLLDQIELQLDTMEIQVLQELEEAIQNRLTTLRQEVLSLRRHLYPQRKVMESLTLLRNDWLAKGHRRRLQEALQRTDQVVGELAVFRERAAVLQEELNSRLAQEMNRTMYRLTVVAGLFLPLGFLTGLLGINVGGMPGVEDPWAFWEVCAGLGILAGAALLLFRRWRWL